MFAEVGAVLSTVAAVCWAVFLASWALGAVYNIWRAPAQVDGRTRFYFLPGWILASIVIFVVTRFVPQGAWAPISFWNLEVAIVGALLLVVSTALALWARWTLGRMWSSIPAVREHHELRTDGPYRITRHPIYTGILGMLLGTAMIVGFGPLLVALLVFGGVFLHRIPREEKLMTETFGEQYVRYQQEVPRLIPFVRV